MIAARVTARVSLVESARKVLPEIKADGMTDRDLKVAVLTAADSSFKAEGRSDDYLTGRFDTVVAGAVVVAKANAKVGEDVKRVVQDAADGSAPTTIEVAEDKFRTDSRDAWKRPAPHHTKGIKS